MTDISMPNKIIMIGLPGSGKTTFLAALWHVVRTKEVEKALSLDKLESDIEYIDRIHNLWLSCQDFGVTQPSVREKVVMSLVGEDPNAVVRLLFPDLAGETFDIQWRDRRWTKDYADLVEGMTGMLLFLHAGKKYTPEALVYLNDTLSNLDADASDEVPSDVNNNLGYDAPHSTYDPDLAASQVKIVDILQSHVKEIAIKLPLPLAVIISAWDLNENVQALDNLNPSKYLERSVPLLDQYLKANGDTFSSHIYGVSALGGSLDDPDVKNSLEDKVRPSDRIKIVYEDTQTHDITQPIKWLIQGNA